MKTTHALILTAGILAFLALPASGQEVLSDNNIVAGARALGMGGAQIGAVNDITATIHNPAALTRIDMLHAQLGLAMVPRDITTRLSSPTATGRGSYEDRSVSVGSIGVAYPVPTDRGSLVFAFAVNRVKDFTGTFRMSGYDEQAFEQDGDVWAGDFTNETVEDGGVDIVSFAGAVDVSPQVSVGLSLDIWTGSYSLDKRILRNNSTDQISWLDLNGGEDDFTGWSLKPSVLYFTDDFRLGAYLRLPMTFHIEQDNYEELYSANDGYFFQIHERIDSFISDNYSDYRDYWGASYRIKAPMEFGVGVALGEPGRRCVAFDLVYESWKDAEIKGDNDPYYFRDKYENTLNWAFGAEHALPLFDSVVRVGYRHEPAKFNGPRTSGGPSIEVMDDRDYLSLGFGVRFDDYFRFDAGYARGFFKQEEGSRTDEETLHRIYAAVTYTMPVAGGAMWR